MVVFYSRFGVIRCSGVLFYSRFDVIRCSGVLFLQSLWRDKV